MRFRGARFIVPILVVGGLVAAGCSSDAKSSSSASSSTSTSSTTTTTPRSPARTVADLLALGRPIVLAHAGGDDSYPHSTPYAFASSVRDGVDVLDMDVQLSGDGVLIVQHDATVDRTTNSTGPVAAKTYEELHELDNAYWWTAEGTGTGHPDAAYTLRGVRTGETKPPADSKPDDFTIPRFRDIAKRFPDYVLNIEIKGTYPDAVPAAQTLAKELKDLDRLDAAVVTSFDDQVLAAFHAAAPGVALTPGLGETTDYVLDNKRPTSGTILQIPPDYNGLTVLTPELVTRAHADGLLLWIWPNGGEYENEAGYGRLLAMGVDGVNAAKPAEGVAALTAATRS